LSGFLGSAQKQPFPIIPLSSCLFFRKEKKKKNKKTAVEIHDGFCFAYVGMV